MRWVTHRHMVRDAAEGRPIRVLFLSHLYPNPSQPTRGIFVHRQARALLRAGIAIKVVAPIPAVPPGGKRFGNYRMYHGVPPSESLDGIEILYPRYVQPPRNMLPGVRTSLFARAVVPTMLREVVSAGADLVHAHMATPDGYASAVLRERLQIPTVCTLRGSDINVSAGASWLIREQTRSAIRGNSSIVAVSEALAVEARSMVQRHVDVVYTGLDADIFSEDGGARAAERQKLHVRPDEVLIGFVGNVIKQKGIFELVHAFFQILPAEPFSRLVVVGDGPELTEVRRLIERLGLSDKVTFRGRLDPRGVADTMNALDVLVLPSWREGFPNVIAEAMACATAVVASNVGGIGEIIEHEVSGILVQPRSTKDLAIALRRMVEDPALRGRFAAAGQAVAAARFSWDRNASEMIQLYQSIYRY